MRMRHDYLLNYVLNAALARYLHNSYNVTLVHISYFNDIMCHVHLYLCPRIVQSVKRRHALGNLFEILCPCHTMEFAFIHSIRCFVHLLSHSNVSTNFPMEITISLNGEGFIFEIGIRNCGLSILTFTRYSHSYCAMETIALNKFIIHSSKIIQFSSFCHRKLLVLRSKLIQQNSLIYFRQISTKSRSRAKMH